MIVSPASLHCPSDHHRSTCVHTHRSALSEQECQTVILGRDREPPCDLRFTSTCSMSAYRLSLVVTLMLAVAFLMLKSGNAQADSYQFAIKEVTVPQRYCGKKLSSALQLICDGVYNSMFKKNGREREMADYPFAYDEFPFLSRGRTSGMLGRIAGNIGRFRRESHGVHEECCINACTLSELYSYCGR